MHSPYLYAAYAITYIALVASGITYLGTHVGNQFENTPLAPVAFLSLLVLSVATMGYLFFYEPVHLYMQGKPDHAVRFFLKTLGTFALFTAIVFGILIFVHVG